MEVVKKLSILRRRGSFHHFRHFAVCEIINNGVLLEVVREFLGQSDIKSTLVYARLKGEKLQKQSVVLTQF